MNLLELQRRMAEDVRRPLTVDWEMQRKTAEGESVEAIAQSYMKPNDRLSSFERLEIYNRQYWFRVIGAVSEDFPALNALLGEKRFDAMVLAYLREVPSTSWTLRDLSGKLAEWLEVHPEFTGRRHQLALDIAKLEWAYVESYDGRRFPPLAAEDMQVIGAETCLTLQPHLQLLAMTYPVDELVLAVRKDTPEGEIVSNAASEEKQAARQKKEMKRMKLPAMRKKAVWLAVHRYEDVVYYRHIDREAYLLLTALREGKPLAEALGLAFAKSRMKADEQAAKIQEYFAHAAELGWFCRGEDEATAMLVQ